MDKRVQPFVHPGPLTLVRVDDHREEVVSNLVDDHPDHAILGALAVRAIFFTTPVVETDHGVFHADSGSIHRNGHRIWVVDGVLAVGLEGLGHSLGAVLLPKGIALLGVIAHGQRRLVAHFHGHGVPNELAAGRPTEVAHILRVEDPRLLSLRLRFLVFPGFLFRDNEDGLVVGLLRLCVATTLGRREHRTRVAQRAGGGHNVVCRHCQFNVVVAKVQRELTVPEELFVLPSFVVAVHDHARVELRDGVQVVVFVLKVLVPTPTADVHAVVDVVPPINAERKLGAGLQRTRQINAHHRLVDGVIQRVARQISHLFDVESSVKRGLQFFQVTEVRPVVEGGLPNLVAVAV